MSPSAQRVHIDFARLVGEEAGSLYFEHLLHHGYRTWPAKLRLRFPSLANWNGVAKLKDDIRTLTGVASDSEILIANRSSRLMRFAATQLAAKCRHVLATDLGWPNYHRILSTVCRRAGCRLTTIHLRREVLHGGLSSSGIVSRVADAFSSVHCNGLFCPAVDNLGVRLPIEKMVTAIRSISELRCVVVDGAQAVGHVPIGSIATSCDILVGGCHKWLQAYNPLGFAVINTPLVTGSVDGFASIGRAAIRMDDPLLNMSQELEGKHLARFGETVNLLPMFTAHAAITDALQERADMGKLLGIQRVNANRLFELATEDSWRPIRIDEPLRTGICLIRARDEALRKQSPETLRSIFHELGIAVTTFRGGYVRLSMPTARFTQEQERQLQNCLRWIDIGIGGNRFKSTGVAGP